MSSSDSSSPYPISQIPDMSRLKAMSSKHHYQDFGIPDRLAVPPGELIIWHPDGKPGSVATRCQLYNQFVIYSKLQEVEIRLGMASWNENTAYPGNWTVDAHVSTAVLETTKVQTTTTTTADASVQTGPSLSVKANSSLGNDSTSIVNGLQEYSISDAATAEIHNPASSGSAALPAPSALPALIRRFTSPRKSDTPSSPSGQVQSLESSSAVLVSAPMVGISKSPQRYTPTTPPTMPHSATVTADLAGLIFAPTPLPFEHSSAPRPAVHADETKAASLRNEDTRLWDRLHAIGDLADDASNHSSENHHSLPAYSAPSTGRGLSRPALPQVPATPKSSASIEASNTHGSANFLPLSSPATQGTLRSRIQHVTGSSVTISHQTSPPAAHRATSSAAQQQPEWMKLDATTYLDRLQQQQQQQVQATESNPQLIDLSEGIATAQAKEKERETLTLIFGPKPPAPAPQINSMTAFPPLLASQAAQAQAPGQAIKGKMKAEEDYAFW
ncbi:MAG: hypothetical protein Q9219_000415 [cf. Caloplaca sp. 3 TL-2023]